MKDIFQIRPELNIPIYRQLTDSVENAIKKRKLQPEQKLPTVQELSVELGIARGTIKRAYDELERQGLIEKRQGRGTFVSYRPPEEMGRKDHAMQAIDRLLDYLGAMGFSPSEAELFLRLKLKERQQRENKLKVAVLECNPENLSRMAQQLRTIAYVDVHSYLTENVQDYPYKLVEEMDLIVTTLSHADFVEELLPDTKKLAKIALRLSPHALSAIAKLKQGSTVGVLCSSLRFGEMLRRTILDYGFSLKLLSPLSLTLVEDPMEYLQGAGSMLLPVGYEKYCSPQQLKALEGYKGKLIPCAYEMDEGSFLNLQEYIGRLWKAKAL